ncbi:class I SAM-dependent methyltransferase [Planomicrobium sp. CPCC 101079]|uniref:class I SAM-dependent methyltransferase n=1 Tax=Planomicrobium sp. CPCC 101079 TaxID=2599618 RepID=UPI0011B403E1|nr:class I SAM-dependent methyltransferase [Planomicrobium sp. CPCC 101079]TWT13138.1 class I SAM-dependent methyltransferase [Planomicrobium sp. CPCC 101079]
MKEQVIETFNQLAAIYANTVDSGSLFNSEYERPAMLAHLPADLVGKKVLDAGCAAGWYTEQLLAKGADVAAVDISPEMVRSAKQRVGTKAEVLCLDLEKGTPFKTASFDVIVSSLTLHYLKNWEETFSEFHRILKPDGVFLFSIHHPFTDINWMEDAHYFSVELINDRWHKEGKVFEVPFYRRPLSEIMNKTLAYFSVDEVIEPLPTNKFKELAPESYGRLMKRPQFLLIKAHQRSLG